MGSAMLAICNERESLSGEVEEAKSKLHGRKGEELTGHYFELVFDMLL